MSSGLIALLDDVAALAKMAAVTLDDAAALTVRASAKSIGVVADDAAVTPRYVIGFSPERELPIIRKIATGSIKNKLLFLLPGVIILGWLTPWIITPLLMFGAFYLCFEGYEKIHEYLHPAARPKTLPEAVVDQEPDIDRLEKTRIAGAIRTDFILSAEIMAIAFATVKDQPMPMQALVLLGVAFGITALVYGAVALIVKADDAGLHLSRYEGRGQKFVRACGRAIVRGMPFLLKGLSALGTVAMLFVGGGILAHGFAEYGAHFLESFLHLIPYGSAVMTVILGGGAGFLVALCVAPLEKAGRRIVKKFLRARP